MPKQSPQNGPLPLDNTYMWRTAAPMLKLVMEMQCCCVALIVMTQVWILTYFGSDIFEKLVGNEICLPLLYLTGIIFGTACYVYPTYWRVALCLTVYSVCIYFSMMVPNIAVKIMMTPGAYGILQVQPQHYGSSGSDFLRVWMPWSLGFVLHLQFSLTCMFIAFVCIRDMYNYEPAIVTKTVYLDSDIVLKRAQPTQNFISIEPTVAVITVVAGDAANNGQTHGYCIPPAVPTTTSLQTPPDIVTYV